MLIHLVCAARPNFMKIAPLYHALKKEAWAKPFIVHTGQHYDINMSDAFFQDLGIPEPDINLEVGSGSHAEQTARVMMAFEPVCIREKPDWIIVVGDVNSTMACTLVASKLGIKIAHLEAGLRSFDRTMPEEINRLVTDVLADVLWTPSKDANENLIKEGIPQAKIQLVGNIMIDSLEMLRDRIESQKAYEAFDFKPFTYGIVTMHRPSNVDDPLVLKKLSSVLSDIAEMVPLIFPIHPRTRRNMEDNGLFNLVNGSKRLALPEPLNYIRFMNLVFNSLFVITDSGGIQEETSYLGIPCLTVRKNTERPITIAFGTNQLCELDDIEHKTEEILRNPARRKTKLDLWDGHTADRIVESIQGLRGQRQEASIEAK